MADPKLDSSDAPDARRIVGSADLPDAAAAIMRRLLDLKPEPLKEVPKATGDRALSQQARRRREAGGPS